MRDLSAALTKAWDGASLLGLRSRFSGQSFDCFPIEVGPELVLLLTLDPGFHMDALRVLRTQDLAECLFPHPLGSMIQEVLQIRGEDEIELPALSIESFATLLETAAPILPLMALYYEEEKPPKHLLGRVLEVEEAGFSLLELNEAARWASEPISLPLAGLTRVDLGGARQEVLYQISGEPD